MRLFNASRYCCLALLSIVAGCTSTSGELQRLRDRLAFVEVGSTTREQVVAHFGPPSVAYEEGRLAVYIFVNGELLAAGQPRNPAGMFSCQLVLAYDSQGLLQRYRALSAP